MLVKVCGMSEQQQALELENIVDIMGFIYYTKSPRFIQEAPSTRQCLRAGVFVNESIEKIKQIGERDSLDIIQLHGDESPAICSELTETYRVVKVFGIHADFDFSQLADFSTVSYFLFDTKTPNYGGSGMQFDWKQLNAYSLSIPFMLSGGIRAEAVSALKGINHPQFAGIDINSGFEYAPGQKNCELIKSFIHEIRN